MARFLDERGRIFGKVNVVDIVVLLAIIAVAVFAVVRFTGSDAATVPLKVTYRVEQVRQATVDAIQGAVKVGGTVRDDGGTMLGKIVAVDVGPTRVEYMTPQGELKGFDSPVFSDVSIVVQGKGTESGGTFRIGNVPMVVGKVVVLRGSTFEVRSAVAGVVSGEGALK